MLPLNLERTQTGRDIVPIFTRADCANSNCHGSVRGGLRFKVGSPDYNAMLEWLQKGAPFDAPAKLGSEGKGGRIGDGGIRGGDGHHGADLGEGCGHSHHRGERSPAEELSADSGEQLHRQAFFAKLRQINISLRVWQPTKNSCGAFISTRWACRPPSKSSRLS